MLDREDPKKPAYPIDSVGNALRLLLLLRDRGQIRLSDASDIIGVGRSTAHRLLAMLHYHGFVAQDENSKLYGPGPALLECGLAAVRDLDVRRLARPTLEGLRERWDETVHLAVMQGVDVLFIDAIESALPVRVAERTGTRIPAHCTSVGKAMLALFPPERLLELYPDDPLPQLTDNSLTSRDKLMIELEQVRDRGYATNRGETERDVGSAGVAIRDPFGRPLAAISIAAPMSRLDEERIAAFGEAAREAATSVTALLG